MLRPEGSRVLFVDDEQDTCSNMADILSDLGYRVDGADDGLTTLEFVRRAQYDVALLDLRMPGMDGLTLYREIRKIRAETVAILVTAYAGTATEREAMTDGIWKVLFKPVNLPRVLDLVNEARGQPLVLIVDCRLTMGSLADRAMAEGAVATCYKPYDVPRLLDTLDQLAKAPG